MAVAARLRKTWSALGMTSTRVPGPHASQLLRCYELTGDKEFRDHAIAYILAYDRYGWDAKARSYHAMLKMDGTPVPPAARV